MPNVDEPLNPFPPVSKSEWIKKVEADLRGASFDELRSTAPGGLELEPLYCAEDLAGSRTPGLPGIFPYVRGAAPLGGWVVRQEYDDPRSAVCAETIREDLARGVDALWLHLGPRYGCRVLTIDELDALLEPVDLAQTSICLDGGSDALAVAAGLLAVAERRNVSYAALEGGLGFDPVALLASEGRIEGGLRARFAELRDLSAWCSDKAPGLRAVRVSGHPYDDGGASTIQELAFTIATGIEYLRQLVNGGMSTDAAARQIDFSYSVSGDFFTQVAKLRAARWLWAKVVVAAGGAPSSAAMQLHCRTSRFTKTTRDPWVNMLRVTAECAASILGGAQSISTRPFDCAIGPASELARRVARNTQIVLQEESHLGKVADPAGGSWFVEHLTSELARTAWDEVRSLEAEGGIIDALGSGRLIDAVAEVADARERSLATRKTPVVGVSEFPDVHENVVEREPVRPEEIQSLVKASLDALDLGAHREQLLRLAHLVNDTDRAAGDLTEACIAATVDGADIYTVATALRHGQPDFFVEPILRWRGSEIWEELRARGEASGLTAFLANLGAIPSHKARSTWAQNLLAAAGIGAIINDGFEDMSALSEAWKRSSASLAVVCGSDEDYRALLEPAVRALKEGGCPVVLVAGRPGDAEAGLRQAGVSDFVFAGANVLNVMSDLLDSVGAGG